MGSGTEHGSPQQAGAQPSSYEVRRWYLDTAAIVGVAAAVMYGLGWEYWTAFYREFDIHTTLIDLGPEKVVATTWPVVLLMVYYVLYYLPWRPHGAAGVKLRELGPLAFFLGWYVGSRVSPERGLRDTAIGGVAGAVAWVLIAYLLRKNETLVRDYIMRFPLGFAAWLLIMWVALGFLCAWNGRYDAHCLMAGRSAAPIVRVETAGASAFPKEGTLIAHMNGRYFIWGRTKSEKQPRTYVVLDGAAPSVSVALPTQ